MEHKHTILGERYSHTKRLVTIGTDVCAPPNVKQLMEAYCKCSPGSSAQCSGTQRSGRQVGWKEVQEGGIYVYIQLICFIVQQKLIQYCKATISQFKQIVKEKETTYTNQQSFPVPSKYSLHWQQLIYFVSVNGIMTRGILRYFSQTIYIYIFNIHACPILYICFLYMPSVWVEIWVVSTFRHYE